jgi:hypothetical protein
VYFHPGPPVWCNLLQPPREINLSSLADYGIAPGLVEAATAGSDTVDEDAQFELSIRLLELVTTKMNAGVPHPVRAHAHVPDSLVNEAVAKMVETHLPPPLTELLRFQLGAIKRMAEAPRRAGLRQKAIMLRSLYTKAGPRALARLLKVSPSTVTRWLKQPAFRQEMWRFQTAFECDSSIEAGEVESWLASPPISLEHLSVEDVEGLWVRYKHLFDWLDWLDSAIEC